MLTPPSDDAKDAYLVALIESHFEPEESSRDLVMVFTQTCRSCQVICMTLNALGFKAAALHSMISQKERTQGLAKFRSAQVRILVATDLASRGLDIPEVIKEITTEVLIVQMHPAQRGKSSSSAKHR